MHVGSEVKKTLRKDFQGKKNVMNSLKKRICCER